MARIGFFLLLIGLASGCDLFMNSDDDEGRTIERWVAAPDMAEARHSFTATVVRDGNVLVAGGMGTTGPLATAELFDVLTNAWKPAPAMQVARHHATATDLGDGLVLIVGGIGAEGVLVLEAELYDSFNNTWTAVGALQQGRVGHSATLMNDGTVMIAGGEDADGEALASVERFFPETTTWETAEAMAIARAYHGAILLDDGELFVVGGRGPDYLRSGERFDPETGNWRATRPIPTGRMGLTLHRIAGGRVLAMAGFYEFAGSNIVSGLVDRYDIESDGWNSLADLPSPHFGHATVRFGNGQFFLISGFGANEFVAGTVVKFVPNPSAPFWRPAVPMINARIGHAAAVLPGERILVAGGQFDQGGAPVRSVEIFESNPSANEQ